MANAHNVHFTTFNVFFQAKNKTENSGPKGKDFLIKYKKQVD